MAAEFDLPDTSTPPDNTYYDTKVVSWNFVVDGRKATLGFIQPGFNEAFPVAEGGEKIILHRPPEGAHMSITELGGKIGNKVVGFYDLGKDGDTATVPGGRNMRIRTGDKAVEYVCIYPGQPAEE